MKTLHITMTCSIILSLVIVFSLQGKSYEYECASNFNPSFDKSVYHTGDAVILNLRDSNLCKPDNSVITVKILDVTHDYANPPSLTTLYIKFSSDNMQLNFTLPKYIDPCCLHKYALSMHSENIGDIGYGGVQFVVAENMTNQTRNIVLTAVKPVISTGTYEEIISRICPVPIPEQDRVVIRDSTTKLITDPGPLILIDYHISSPTGKQIISEDFISPLAGNCDTNYSTKSILPDINGTWSVYSVARWIEKNSTQQIQSKPLTFTVKESLVGDKKMEKIKIGTATKMPGNMIDMLDWSSDGKSILVYDHPAYSQNGNSYLELLNMDGNVTKKIEISHTDQISSVDARILPSGDLVILNGGLNLYNIQDDTQYTITKNVDIIAFDLVAHDKMIYSERSSDMHDTSSSYTTWLSDSNGRKISRLFTSDNVLTLHASPDMSKIAFVEQNTGNDMNQFAYTLKIYDVKENKISTFVGSENIDYVKWSPNSQFLVYRTSSSSYGGMGIIGLTDYTGSFFDTLYEYSQNEPSFVISPDGKYLDFSSNEPSSQKLELYKMEFVHPIPEFSLVIPILAIGIFSLLVFYRFQFRAN